MMIGVFERGSQDQSKGTNAPLQSPIISPFTSLVYGGQVTTNVKAMKNKVNQS
jgi:hypothetical protein